ncbi:hypothetical protein D3C85_1761590 [compost metagenome]
MKPTFRSEILNIDLKIFSIIVSFEATVFESGFNKLLFKFEIALSMVASNKETIPKPFKTQLPTGNLDFQSSISL